MAGDIPSCTGRVVGSRTGVSLPAGTLSLAGTPNSRGRRLAERCCSSPGVLRAPTGTRLSPESCLLAVCVLNLDSWSARSRMGGMYRTCSSSLVKLLCLFLDMLDSLASLGAGWSRWPSVINSETREFSVDLRQTQHLLAEPLYNHCHLISAAFLIYK